MIASNIQLKSLDGLILVNVVPLSCVELDCIQYSHTKFQMPRVVDDQSFRYSREWLGPIRYSTWSAVTSSVWVNAFQLSATAHSKMRSIVVFSEVCLTTTPSRVPAIAFDAAI